MANYSKCPQCGSWVPKGDSECPHCGAEQGLLTQLKASLKALFPSAPPRRSGRQCVSCDRVVGENDTVCPHCGTAQTGARKAVRAARDLLPGGASVTQGILIVCAGLFIMPVLAGGPDLDRGAYLSGGNDRVGVLMGATTRNIVVTEGDLKVPRFPAEYEPPPGVAYADTLRGGQYWRLVTAVFLHFGIMHIAFNAFAVFYVGRMVEELYGGGWYLALYVVTGVAGFLVSYLSRPLVISAGASGAIFGLIGVGVVHCWRHRFANQQLLRLFVGWALLGFVFGLVPGSSIDNWAHGGGFIAGMALAWLLPAERVTRGQRNRRIGAILGNLCGALVVVSFVMAVLWARSV